MCGVHSHAGTPPVQPVGGIGHFNGSMTRLSRVSAADLETVRRALTAAVDGPFFPEWEFPILLPLDRDGVKDLLQRWPKAIEDPVTAALTLSVLNGLCGYPHHHEDLLFRWTGRTKSELRELLTVIRQS